MNYPHIFERVYLRPLCVTPERFASIHAFLMPRIKGDGGMEINLTAAPGGAPAAPNKSYYSGKRRQKAGPTEDARGNLDLRFFNEVKPGVAGVPIYGALAKNVSAYEEMCGGATDINAPQEALRQAVADPNVQAIVLDFDSPGGEVTGIPEFGAQVRAAAQVKPVYAFTDAGMCSAAYWIASQATEIYATGSAYVGSIGTYLAWLDPSIQMEMQGLKLQLFQAGKYKGIGLPGRALSDDDKALLQSKVTQINDAFQSAVTSTRTSVKPETMEGQTFSGADAEAAGLIDGVMGSWDEFVALI
jgi:signal peptide peptidase SppA